MSLHRSIFELAATHRLDAEAIRQLQHLAGLHEEPVTLSRRLPQILALCAAGFGGLGVIFWVAANWDSFGRISQFVMLQGLVLVMCAGALLRPAARVPLGGMALLGIGALFAFFGQTYQTGADPWQLFALWAGLGLPLCLAARNDVLWTFWTGVVMTAIALWVHAYSGYRWRPDPDVIEVHMMASVAAAAVMAGLSRPLQRHTGAGGWAFRFAAMVTVGMLAFSAIAGLFHDGAGHYYSFGLVLLVGLTVLLAQRTAFDIHALSVSTFGLNVVLTAGLIYLMFDDFRGSLIASLFVVGLLSAIMLAISVSCILALSRARNVNGEDA